MSTHSNEAKTRISQRQKFVKVGSTAAVQDDDFENENTHTHHKSKHNRNFFWQKGENKAKHKVTKNTYTLKEKKSNRQKKRRNR